MRLTICARPHIVYYRVLCLSRRVCTGQPLTPWCRMIKVKVPHLMKKNGMNATDLMRKANIAYVTALRLSKGEAQAISFEVLESLCKLFEVQVKDILEYLPDKK